MLCQIIFIRFYILSKNHTQITSSCLQALVSITRASVSVCHLSSYCHFGKTTPTVYALLCNIFICKSVLDSHLEPFYLFVIMHRDSVDKKIKLAIKGVRKFRRWSCSDGLLECCRKWPCQHQTDDKKWITSNRFNPT